MLFSVNYLMFILYIVSHIIINNLQKISFNRLMSAKQVITFSIVEMTKYIAVLCI